MKETLGKILSALVRSLFITGVMFVIVFSVMTGEFPPSYQRIKNIFVSLQSMNQVSRHIHDETQALQNQNPGIYDSNEADVMALEKLNERRAQIGAGLMGGDVPANSAGSSGASGESDTRDLKSSIRDLQSQLSKLQNRVASLEEQLAHRKME